MNSIRYPKYICSIVIILIIFVIIYYVYHNLNKTIEGATTEESVNKSSSSPSDATKTLKQQIQDFTQEIYNTVKFYLTSKTKESENKTTEILKTVDEKMKNIEKPKQVDPELKRKLKNLKKSLEIKLNKLKFMHNPDTGTSIEILSSK